MVKNDYGKIPSISMGEIEHKLNKASDKTEGTTHKSTEIKNNIGEKKQEKIGRAHV